MGIVGNIIAMSTMNVVARYISLCVHFITIIRLLKCYVDSYKPNPTQALSVL